MKLAVFHLLNDYSGSSKVLRNVLDAVARRGADVELHTSPHGVLDEPAARSNVRLHRVPYRFGGHLTALRYAIVQMRLFFSGLRYAGSDHIFYINTILPVGAALAGKLTGHRVIYHYHENAHAKGLVYRILSGAMQWLASDIICVSDYQRGYLKRTRRVHLIPDSLPDDFVRALHPDADSAFDRRRVLMLGSLKAYKGTREFAELASMLPEYEFELVINADRPQIDAYLDKQGIAVPANLTIHSRQTDVAPFYNRASVVVNLSNRSTFIEAFGLTPLEGMAAGLPAIAPSVGGVTEIVADKENGYTIDVRNLEQIAERIRQLLTDRELYRKLSAAALATSRRNCFTQAGFEQSLEKVLDSISEPTQANN